MKQTAFGQKDEGLVKQITAFQKEKGLPSFIEAVRQLCNEALECRVNVKISLKKEK